MTCVESCINIVCARHLEDQEQLLEQLFADQEQFRSLAAIIISNHYRMIENFTGLVKVNSLRINDAEKPHNTVSFAECIGTSRMEHRFCDPQFRQLLVFTDPSK